jgi:hypothetical protein
VEAPVHAKVEERMIAGEEAHAVLRIRSFGAGRVAVDKLIRQPE